MGAKASDPNTINGDYRDANTDSIKTLNLNVFIVDVKHKMFNERNLVHN